MKEQTAEEMCGKHLDGIHTEDVSYNMIIKLMEKYATLKLQEQAKEIERLKGKRDMFMERCNQLTKTNDELQAIITKHITNH